VLQLTRLNGPVFALNPDLIERAEATPDTVVTLVNGSKYVIRESLDELIELVRRYRADVVAAAQFEAGDSGDPSPPRPRHLGEMPHNGRASVVLLRRDPEEQ
jgi:flagellar protein FlbD